ncbi:CDP-diacylglycerol diphosphatase [Mycolicibacterium sp.]|uniref:CDP-diacylglycerol diphosphatase n=1 Tax=Mycolicibacterium sp. TaxID=2320850 RepID=UPI0028A75C54|nr:CDP-diacylglycerol diphosphatase [Mycolicibacterium sp.]
MSEPDVGAGQPYNPPSDCGKDTDTDTLWVGVKDATARNPRPNMEVCVPEKGKFGYAIRDGNNDRVQGKYNLLLIPKARLSGIECPKILQADALNLWEYAWAEATKRFTGTDVMVGINSYDGRSHNQLHIHLTGVLPRVKQELADLDRKIPTDLSQWNTSVFAIGPQPYAYRIVKVPDLRNNPFNLVHSYISQDDMFAQSLGVVSAGKGFYLINTQGKPTQPNQPAHGCTVDHHYGTSTVENLMNRG